MKYKTDQHRTKFTMNCPCISIMQKKLFLQETLLRSSLNLQQGMIDGSPEMEELQRLIREVRMEIYNISAKLRAIQTPSMAPEGFTRSSCIGICANTVKYKPGLNIMKNCRTAQA